MTTLHVPNLLRGDTVWAFCSAEDHIVRGIVGAVTPGLVVVNDGHGRTHHVRPEHVFWLRGDAQRAASAQREHNVKEKR